MEARDITWDSTPLEWAIVGSGMRLGHDRHPDWPAVVATLRDAAAYAIAVIATPAGISGTVLLLPLQVSVLGTPNPGGHPDQSALQRCHPWRPVPVPAARSGHRAPGRPARRRDPARRDRWICHPRRPAARPARLRSLRSRLLPLGGWITATRPLPTASTGSPAHPAPGRALIVLGCVVGCSGGIYGVGGGSILAPILIGTGRPAAEVAPAALASTP
jgi:hypothetical protein